MQIWSGHAVFYVFSSFSRKTTCTVTRFLTCFHRTNPRPLLSLTPIGSFYSLSVQWALESTYAEMLGDEEDDVRIRAHMDFIEHTFPVRFSGAPPGIPWCGGENQNKTHDRRHSTRSPPSFSPSVNLPGCGCMKGISQRFIGYRSLLGAAAMLLPLPYCDNSRSDVYREEERWFCHWLPRGQPHWSIWPNCANPCVRRMEPPTDIGWQTGSMALQRCLFKRAPLRPLLPCTNTRNSNFEQVLIQRQAFSFAISDHVRKLAHG